MFNIEEILGIKFKDRIDALEQLTSIILLVPEAIEDTISKINKLGFANKQNLTFVNGYAVQDSNSFINRRGETISCNNGELCGNFSCNYIIFNDGFIDGTGRQLRLKTKPFSVKSFSEGLAPVESLPGVWDYVDLSGKCKNSGFTLASCFFNGYAIVKVRHEFDSFKYVWAIIDHNFKAVQTCVSSDSNDAYFENLLYFFDHNPNLFKADESIKKIQNGASTIFIDKKTGFSIRVYEILKAISEHFNIPLSKGTIEEQLTDIICKVATKDTFILDTRSLSFFEIEIVKGVKVATNGGKGEISFDSKDVELIRLAREEKK